MSVVVRNRPKVGVVAYKWAWSVNFRAHYIYFLLCPGLSSHKLGNYVIISTLVLGCSPKGGYTCTPPYPPWIRHCSPINIFETGEALHGDFQSLRAVRTREILFLNDVIEREREVKQVQMVVSLSHPRLTLPLW